MSFVKNVLLGTAALAAMTVSAQADDLKALKTQIEALNNRISQLESAPSVPAGYQMLSVTGTENIVFPEYANARFFGTKATKISVLPTADVPASTEISWTGYVAAALTFKSAERDGIDANNDGDFTDVGDTLPTESEAFDVLSKAGLEVKGKTDTAVGEVGVSIALIADANTVIGGTNRAHDASVATDGFKGYWKMTPELELSGGVFGSAAKNSQGWKGQCSCYFLGEDPTGHFGTNLGNDPAQIRLTYKSGPLAMAVALEDYDNVANESALGVAGEFKYSGDDIAFELNAGYWDSAVTGSDANWSVSAGAKLGLGEIASLTAALGTGEDRHSLGNADNYVKGSIMATFTMSDSVSAELGMAYRDYKARNDIWAVGGGIYYQPVDQLTVGLEGLYSDEKGTLAVETVEAAFITVYRF
jgi:opacity protein-like surface antigen